MSLVKNTGELLKKLKKNPFQMKDLEQFSTCIGQKEQNLFQLD